MANKFSVKNLCDKRCKPLINRSEPWNNKNLPQHIFTTDSYSCLKCNMQYEVYKKMISGVKWTKIDKYGNVHGIGMEVKLF